jgi:hypothetical protein
MRHAFLQLREDISMDRAIAGPATHRRHHVLVAAVISMLAACDAAHLDGVTVATGDCVANSINGSVLPYRVQNSTRSILIASATAEMHANGRYEIAADGTVDGVAGPIIRDSGNYSVSGSTISFSSAVYAMQYSATASAASWQVAMPGILVSSTSELRLQLGRQTNTGHKGGGDSPPDSGSIGHSRF